ncbi:MAG TPA: hypothetical protein VHA30_04315 [Patescibacteria group bacterium]|nr:hypothetical protein [Patescibacteria group bacterium]
MGPSWGGGIEVEMSYRSGVPVVILCEAEKLRQRKVSRLLRGNPAVRAVLAYGTQEEGLRLLAEKLAHLLKKQPVTVQTGVQMSRAEV